MVPSVSAPLSAIRIVDLSRVLSGPFATQQLIDDVSCKSWARFIDKKELSYFQQRHAVISTRLMSGRTLIHVYNDDDPGDGFEEALGDLEDLYFATILGRHDVSNACD